MIEQQLHGISPLGPFAPVTPTKIKIKKKQIVCLQKFRSALKYGEFSSPRTFAEIKIFSVPIEIMFKIYAPQKFFNENNEVILYTWYIVTQKKRKKKTFYFAPDVDL